MHRYTVFISMLIHISRRNTVIKKSGLTIPCHWDRKVMEEILRRPVAKGELAIIEVYGCISAKFNPLMHGRADSTVTYVGRNEAMAFRQFLRNESVVFTYLLNAPLDNLFKEGIRAYVSWVLAVLRPDALTISSLQLMQLIRETDEVIPIHVSTIAGVRSAKDLERFLDIRPSRIVPHHDLGKDWRALDEVVACAEKNEVEVELLVTESCLFSCPIRDAHYSHIAQPANSTDSHYHEWCKNEKKQSPGEYLRAGGATRHEDLYLLEQRGVRLFKISGRDRPAGEMPGVVVAYQKRQYDGDFFRLLDVAPVVKKEYPYISNRALDGFLKNYPQESQEAQKRYCDQWTLRLYQEGNFRTRDVR